MTDNDRIEALEREIAALRGKPAETSEPTPPMRVIGPGAPSPASGEPGIINHNAPGTDVVSQRLVSQAEDNQRRLQRMRDGDNPDVDRCITPMRTPAGKPIAGRLDHVGGDR